MFSENSPTNRNMRNTDSHVASHLSQDGYVQGVGLRMTRPKELERRRQNPDSLQEGNKQRAITLCLIEEGRIFGPFVLGIEING
jgi:hypothetical protein